MKLILKSSELFSEFRAYSRVQSAEFRVQIFSKISRSRRIPAFFGWAGRIAQGKGKKEKVKVIVTLRVGIKNVELFPTFYYLNAVFDTAAKGSALVDSILSQQIRPRFFLSGNMLIPNRAEGDGFSGSRLIPKRACGCGSHMTPSVSPGNRPLRHRRPSQIRREAGASRSWQPSAGSRQLEDVTLRVEVKMSGFRPTFYYLNAVFDPSPLFSQRKHAHRNGAGRLIWNVFLSV